MAEDISVLVQRLSQLESELNKGLAEISQAMALNHVAVVKRRIQSEGVPGAQYSTKPILATRSMFTNKSNFKPTMVESTSLYRNDKGKILKSKSKRKKVPMGITFKNKSGKDYRGPVMVLEQGYKELRAKDGKPSDIVNLTFTGRMMQSISIIDTVQEGNVVYSLIGASTPEDKQKLWGLSIKYGDDLLAPNAEEKVMLEQIAAEHYQELLKKLNI